MSSATPAQAKNYMISDKDRFIIELGDKAEIKKVLNRLVKESEVLRIQVEELIAEAIIADKNFINDNERATWRIMHRMPGQHDVMFDTDCEKSPYGMHGKARTHILRGKCIWCSIDFE